MGLPTLLEIRPAAGPLTAEITVPGSKSITNRALILAALAPGPTVLRGALWSEDTQVMAEALQQLGLRLEITTDLAEPGNRTIAVWGSGNVPAGGTPGTPLELFVGNAGTAARFLTALLCLGKGAYRLSGVPRMHERPQAALFDALRHLGYQIDSPNDRLPAVIHGAGARSGRTTVSVDESSQFASALLLCAQRAGWEVEVTGANTEELPYVEMTRQLVHAFPEKGGEFMIEPDASSGSYFVAADWLLSSAPGSTGSSTVPNDAPQKVLRRGISVRDWPRSGWQVDARFPKYLPLPERVSRERDLGDSIMTAIVLAPFAWGPVHFTELHRLRVQECERVQALRTELTKLGARIREEGDTLAIEPSPLHGAEISTYHDHRMAMCFSILGLKVPGIKIENPCCVKKTFPNFFQKLAGPMPHGLGVELLDGQTGQKLAWDDLVTA